MGKTIYHIKNIDTNTEIVDANQKSFDIEVWKYDEDVYNAWHQNPSNQNQTLDIFTISTKIDDLSAENLSLVLGNVIYESIQAPNVILENNVLKIQYASTDELFRTYVVLKLLHNSEEILVKNLLFNQNKVPIDFVSRDDESVNFRLNEITFEINIRLKDNKTIKTYGSTFSYQVRINNQQINTTIVDDKIVIYNHDDLLGNFELSVDIVSDKIPSTVSKKYLLNFLQPLTRDIYTLKNNEIIIKQDIATGNLLEIIVKQLDTSKDNIIYLKS